MALFAVVFFVSFELLLNIASWCMHCRQHRRWKQALEGKRDLTIMCIGESTTFRSYPEELQQILREKFPDKNIEVIDLGRSGMDSIFILDQFERDLDRFDPDIVIAMMGINDGYIFDDLTSANKTAQQGPTQWWERLRTVKFLRLFFSGRFASKRVEKQKHVLECRVDEKKIERMLEKIEASIKQYPEILKSKPIPKKSLEDSNVETFSYELTLDRQQNCELLESIIRDHPLCLSAYYDLAQIYIVSQDYDGMMQVYDRLYKAFPDTSFCFGDVALFYDFAIKVRELEQAAKIIERLIKDGYCDNIAYDKLANTWCEHEQKVIDLYKARMLQHPYDMFNYYQLAVFYKRLGRYSQACEIFSFIIDAFDEERSNLTVQTFLYYSKCLRLLGKDDQIPSLIQKIINKYPFSFSSCYWGVLGVHELEQQNEARADEYFSMVSELEQNNQNPITVENYSKICELTLERNIVFIAMQYPLRKIGPLKAMLGKYVDRILFLSNFDCFKKAVMEQGHATFFYDQFGGDFGHTTKAGNLVLAKNIAAFLIRNVLNVKEGHLE